MFTRIGSILVAAAACAALAGIVSLEGCATTPTGAQSAIVSVVVDAAVGIAVQNGSKDPAVWASRAKTISGIATQLKAVDSGVATTLPLLTAALEPLLVKAALGPADTLAANALIVALTQVIQTNIPAGQNASAAIQAVLQDVITATSLYVPVS